MATAPSRHRLPSRLFWVTEVATGTNHLVTEAAFANGMKSGGMYRALCGNQFSAAPMIEGPRGCCAACRAALEPAHAQRHSKKPCNTWWRHLRARFGRRSITSGGNP